MRILSPPEDVRISVASKRFVEDSFLNRFFHHFPVMSSSGNPPRSSGGTGERFYIDRLLLFFCCCSICSFFFHCPFMIHHLGSRLAPGTYCRSRLGLQFYVLIVTVAPLRCLFRPGQSRSRWIGVLATIANVAPAANFPRSQELG